LLIFCFTLLRKNFFECCERTENPRPRFNLKCEPGAPETSNLRTKK
jgi:hypothetical protein